MLILQVHVSVTLAPYNITKKEPVMDFYYLFIFS